jgi:hypothetical protein
MVGRSGRYRGQGEAGGSHVTGPISELVERAGFDIQALNTYYMLGEPKVFSYTFEGISTSR